MESEADYVEACIMILSSDLPIKNQHLLFEAMRTSMIFATVGTKIEHAVSKWLNKVEQYLKPRNNPCRVSKTTKRAVNTTLKDLGVGILNSRSLHRITQNKHSFAHYVQFSYKMACDEHYVNKLKYKWTGSVDALCEHIDNIKFIDFDFDFQTFPDTVVPMKIHRIYRGSNIYEKCAQIMNRADKRVRFGRQIGGGAYAKVIEAEVNGKRQVARISRMPNKRYLIRAIKGDTMQRDLSAKEHCAPYVYDTVSLYDGNEYIHFTFMEKCPSIQFTIGDLVRHQDAMDHFISRLATCFRYFNEIFGDRIVLMDRKMQNIVGVTENLKF